MQFLECAKRVLVVSCFAALLVSAPMFASPDANDAKKPAATATKPAAKPAANSAAKKGVYRLPRPPQNFELPILTIEQPVHDWGSVVRGAVVEHTFKIKNTGGSALIIQEVKPQCGCTAVDKPVDPIAVGAEAEITLKVDTKRFKGTLKKTARVTSNANRQPIVLTMQGAVEPLLKLDPENPKITVVRGAEAVPYKVKMQRTSKQNAKVVSVNSKSTVIAPTLTEVEAGNRWEVDLKVNLDKNQKRNYFYETLLIKVSTGDSEIELPVRATVVVQDRIHLQPKSAYYPRKDTDSLRIDGSPPLKRFIEIKSVGDANHSFKVIGVENNTENFKTRLDTLDAGKAYQLAVTLEQVPAGTQRTVRETIIVKTDDPDQPELKITAMALFSR